LLVLGAIGDDHERCWLKVRIPARPNDAAAWVPANRVQLLPTAWRIVVSRSARRLTVYRAGRRLRRFAVVVGAPATPTPAGLFSIVGAWRSPPRSFPGAWIFGLTAHSDVLSRFEGGNGEIGIHGRGGPSLLDPLGSAASHGCVRLANAAIGWIAHTIGPRQLPGIPIQVR
jgi:lipoprotein-anchoring transpeptidase ErfK/SrfK